MCRRLNNAHTMLVLLAALLLRAAIPDGYMPASWGSGLLVKLCPAGLPAGAMQALAGEHEHHHHGDAGHGDDHFDAERCPIGHLLSAAVAIDALIQLDVVPAPDGFRLPLRAVAATRAPTSRHARDPPA